MTSLALRKKALAFFVALLLAATMLVVAQPTKAEAASYGNSFVTSRSLTYDKNLVKAVGTQQAYSVSCYCFSYAYAQTIVTGKTHYWYEYDQYGGKNGQKGARGKAVDGYKYYSYSSQADILSRLYTSINQGHPCVLRVKNSSGGSHWVCVIGYKGATDPNNLKTSQFLIIDPASKWATTEPAKLSRYTLYTTSRKGNYNLRVSTKTVGTTSSSTNNATSISGLAAVTSATAFPAADTQTATVAGPYVLVPQCAPSSAIDLAGQKTANKTNVHLWGQHGGKSQQFYLVKNNDGTFSIQSALEYGSSNNAFLHVVDQYSINGRNVHLYAGNSNLNSHWYVERNTDGSYSFRNANSDLYLDVAGASKADGTNVRTWVWDSNSAKKFTLVRGVEPVQEQVTYGVALAQRNGLEWDSDKRTQELNVTIPWKGEVGILAFDIVDPEPSGYVFGCDLSSEEADLLYDEAYAAEHMYVPSGFADEDLSGRVTCTLKNRLAFQKLDDGYSQLLMVYGVTPGYSRYAIMAHGQVAYLNVTVLQPEEEIELADALPASIELDRESLDLEAGSSEQLVATYVYDDEPSEAYGWMSDDESIATVSDGGLVTGVAAGETTVYAISIDGACMAECTVTVSEVDDELPSLAEAVVSVASPQTYTGKALTPAPTVKLDGETLVAGTDYAVSYKNNVEVGTATVTVAGKGDYTGSKSVTFEIVAKSEPKPVGPASWTRLAGESAFKTMDAIISKGGFEKGGTVVLASLEGYWDALTAAGVAGLEKAPVVMSTPDGLSPEATAQLKKLAPKKIVVCGGTYWLPQKVLDQAKAAAGTNPEVVRLAGDNAAITAAKIAEYGKGQWSTTAIVATAGTFQDALAAAPVSYAKGMPIFLAQFDFAKEEGYITADTVKAMQDAGVKQCYIAGGTYWLPAQVKSDLEKAGIKVLGQLGGASAVETSGLVAELACGTLGMHVDNMGVANVAQHYDALASAAFCGRNNSVLVLVSDTNRSVVDSFVAKNASKIFAGYIFGGTGSVSDASKAALEAATK